MNSATNPHVGFSLEHNSEGDDYLVIEVYDDYPNVIFKMRFNNIARLNGFADSTEEMVDVLDHLLTQGYDATVERYNFVPLNDDDVFTFDDFLKATEEREQ